MRGFSKSLYKAAGTERELFDGHRKHFALFAVGSNCSDIPTVEFLALVRELDSLMLGIGPADPIEAMLAAQMIASHNAAMECHRRAMLGEQTFEGRNMALGHAAKASRTFAALVEALNRHRGKRAGARARGRGFNLPNLGRLEPATVSRMQRREIGTAPSPEPAPTPAPPPKTKRDVHHTSIYIPRDAFERLREISFHERAKIHDLIMEGISRVIESRGHPERAAREK